MNKKALALIAIITAAAIGTGAAYTNQYFIEQADVHIRDSNVTIDNSNVTLGENVTITNPPEPTPTPKPTAEPTPSPTPAPAPTPTPTPPGWLTYEFNLKTEYINNATALATLENELWQYQPSKPWRDNYHDYVLAMQPRHPQMHIGLNFAISFEFNFNEETGYTKVKYRISLSYTLPLEAVLPKIAEAGWTKTFT